MAEDARVLHLIWTFHRKSYALETGLGQCHENPTALHEGTLILDTQNIGDVVSVCADGMMISSTGRPKLLSGHYPANNRKLKIPIKDVNLVTAAICRSPAWGKCACVCTGELIVVSPRSESLALECAERFEIPSQPSQPASSNLSVDILIAISKL